MNLESLNEKQMKILKKEVFNLDESKVKESTLPNYWGEKVEKYRSFLTKEERHVLRKHFIDCTEDEKMIRKRGVLKIQNEIEKKTRKSKKIIKTKQMIDNANKEINWCDKTKFLETTTSSKIKISRKIGKYLVYHGKGKQGLEYLRQAKSYIEDLYEKEHPKTLSENILYEKMSNLVH
jgi:hypothetical protein